MGIKDLWSILLPFAERKPLYELEGKIVAVDLAGWICESLNVVDYAVQPKMYLRNLFFRVCHLLLCGVTPVFVLEGDAPSLKYDVICKRNEIQFRGAKPRHEPNLNDKVIRKPKKGRTRFNHVLKQCEDLLMTMGVQCVQGPGEAEAFCAYLNKDGLVDGVISQDSDCFAYGAKKVYRNFSISHQGNIAASGGAVDIYDLEIVQKSIDIGQNKMIVLALLSGCDYCPDGIGGIGKDTVLKLFNRYKNDQILDHIKSWRDKDTHYTELEMKVDNKNICVNCGHHGKVQNHGKNGCSICRIHRGCDASLWKEERLSLKAELQIRKKALAVLDFPSQEIIDEFLNRPTNVPSFLNLKWQQPNIIKFLKIMSKQLQWDELYCFQKFLPLLTRWQILHYNSNNQNIPLKGVLYPDFIKKKRTLKGIPCFEIIWKDEIKCFDNLIPNEQIKNYLEQNATDSLWSTIEPINLFEKIYPEIVNEFIDKKNLKTKKKIKRTAIKTPTKIKRIKIGNNSLNDMSGLLEEIQNIEKKNRKKSEEVSATKKGQKRLSTYLVKGKENINAIKKTKRKKNFPDSSINITNLENLDFSLTEMDSSINISQEVLQIINKPSKESYFMGKRLYFDAGNTTSPMKEIIQDEKTYLNDSIENIIDNKTSFDFNSTPILIKRFFERNNISPIKNLNEKKLEMKSKFFADSFLESVLGNFDTD